MSKPNFSQVLKVGSLDHEVLSLCWSWSMAQHRRVAEHQHFLNMFYVDFWIFFV